MKQRMKTQLLSGKTRPTHPQSGKMFGQRIFKTCEKCAKSEKTTI